MGLGEQVGGRPQVHQLEGKAGEAGHRRVLGLGGPQPPGCDGGVHGLLLHRGAPVAPPRRPGHSGPALDGERAATVPPRGRGADVVPSRARVVALVAKTLIHAVAVGATLVVGALAGLDVVALGTHVVVRLSLAEHGCATVGIGGAVRRDALRLRPVRVAHLPGAAVGVVGAGILAPAVVRVDVDGVAEAIGLVGAVRGAAPLVGGAGAGAGGPGDELRGHGALAMDDAIGAPHVAAGYRPRVRVLGEGHRVVAHARLVVEARRRRGARVGGVEARGEGGARRVRAGRRRRRPLASRAGGETETEPQG